MKMLVGILSAAVLFVAGTAFAAQQRGDELIQRCMQDAQKSGVQPAEREAFIINCINDEVGYERSKPGEAGGGGE